MGKLEQYAKALEKKKIRARMEIEAIESMKDSNGKSLYVVPDAYKEVAYSSTPNRVNKATYLNQPMLDLRRIRSAKRLYTDEVYFTSPINGQASFKTDDKIALSVQGTPKQMTDKLNRLIKQAKPSDALYNALLMIVDEPGVVVSDKYDASKRPWELNKYITFTSTLPLETIRDLASFTNVDPETREATESNAKHRQYISNIKNKIRQADGTYKDNPLADIDDEVIESLESVMNASSAWKVAGAYEDLESEQVKENWTKLYKAANDAKKDSDDKILNDLLTAIENEDYNVANNIVNNRINQAMEKTQKKKHKRKKK